MSVKASELETPERGLNLVTRETQEEDRSAKRKREEASELASMRARIEAARAVLPPDNVRHCLDCWERGRDAAVKAIEGAKTT